MGVSLISVTIQDAGGNKRAVVLPCADTETPADIQTFLTAHLPKMDAMISGIIVDATLTQALVLPGGLNASPADDKLVSDGGLFSFSATGTSYRHSMFVPTVADSLMSNDKSIPDAGAVATWEQSVLSGESVIAITNKYAQALAAFLGGKRRNRK